MEETKTQIQGEIVKIFYPSNGEFGFDDFTYVSFLLKTAEGNCLCCGESIPIFVSENVILVGTLSRSSKGPKMDFSTIKIDLSDKASKTKYFKFICGNATYERIAEGIEEDSGRKFATLGQRNEYVNEKLKYYLDNENYAVLQSYNGVGDKTAKKIISKYQSNAGFEKMYNDLACYGLTLRDCSRLAKSQELKARFKTEDEIVKFIKKNPYRLMQYVDFSFNKCDIFHSKQGGKVDANPRILAALNYVVKMELAKGHTYSTKDTVLMLTNQMLDGTLYGVNHPIDISHIILCYNELIRVNALKEDKQGRIYLGYIYNMENYVRQFVFNALKYSPVEKNYLGFIEDYEKKNGIKFGREQKLAIENSLRNRVSVITGGPGTGKTSSLAAMIKILMDTECLNENDIALCAPTGKAARRMMESINGALGTDMIATTIHTLLEVDPTSGNLESFVYNQNNKLYKKVIVVDEASMIDLKIAYSLLSAIKDTTKVIFVGDIEQLPPVGYGYFLRDIIESGIPCVKLLEIHRQKGDSTIIQLSQNIRDERLNFSDLFPKQDFRFVSLPTTYTYEEKMAWIVETFVKSMKKVGVDQTMVLTPLKGETIKKNNPKSKRFGGQQISLAIQDRILPHKDKEPEFEKNGWIFRLGSKVIVTKNDNSKGIVNGEIGYIEGIYLEDKKIDVDFDGKTVTLDETNIEDLKLAYAITVHKSQGSEWKNVIYVCFEETSMNKKPLVYTAITRAKSGLLVVGDQNAFLNCIYNKEEYRRSRILN